MAPRHGRMATILTRPMTITTNIEAAFPGNIFQIDIRISISRHTARCELLLCLPSNDSKLMLCSKEKADTDSRPPNTYTDYPRILKRLGLAYAMTLCLWN